MFTHGKDREYERFMQEQPNNNKGTGCSNKSAPFRYRYADINCEYCVHYKKCEFVFCSAIMENLDDLLQDDDFITAIENAEQCETPHKTALVTIKKRMEEESDVRIR